MLVGVHLPQYGHVAGPDAITRAARHAEELGFSDVWVSDHTVHPAAQDYPSPYLYDPLLSLAWAGAATQRVGLGTSVLVVPTHNPLGLANSLASLDALSGGRLIVGAGAGWSEAEVTRHSATNSHRGVDGSTRLSTSFEWCGVMTRPRFMGISPALTRFASCPAQGERFPSGSGAAAGRPFDGLRLEVMACS